MTKQDFLWCVRQCDNPPVLRLHTDSDGWIYTARKTIVGRAIGAPSILPNGTMIGTSRPHSFLVQCFLGGELIEYSKNAAMSRRAEAALDKYTRWLNEFCAE